MSNGIKPIVSIFCLISGSARMRFISSCSLSTISRGVFAGASSMCHDTASKPGAGAASASGGTSGNSGSRVVDDTARARSLPSLISGIDAPASAQPSAMCPPAMS